MTFAVMEMVILFVDNVLVILDGIYTHTSIMQWLFYYLFRFGDTCQCDSSDTSLSEEGCP